MWSPEALPLTVMVLLVIVTLWVITIITVIRDWRRT